MQIGSACLNSERNKPFYYVFDIDNIKSLSNVINIGIKKRKTVLYEYVRLDGN